MGYESKLFLIWMVVIQMKIYIVYLKHVNHLKIMINHGLFLIDAFMDLKYFSRESHVR
jgi:hypothetical protein